MGNPTNLLEIKITIGAEVQGSSVPSTELNL